MERYSGPKPPAREPVLPCPRARVPVPASPSRRRCRTAPQAREPPPALPPRRPSAQVLQEKDPPCWAMAGRTVSTFLLHHEIARSDHAPRRAAHARRLRGAEPGPGRAPHSLISVQAKRQRPERAPGRARPGNGTARPGSVGPRWIALAPTVARTTPADARRARAWRSLGGAREAAWSIPRRGGRRGPPAGGPGLRNGATPRRTKKWQSRTPPAFVTPRDASMELAPRQRFFLGFRRTREARQLSSPRVHGFAPNPPARPRKRVDARRAGPGRAPGSRGVHKTPRAARKVQQRPRTSTRARPKIQRATPNVDPTSRHQVSAAQRGAVQQQLIVSCVAGERSTGERSVAQRSTAQHIEARHSAALHSPNRGKQGQHETRQGSKRRRGEAREGKPRHRTGRLARRTRVDHVARAQNGQRTRQADRECTFFLWPRTRHPFPRADSQPPWSRGPLPLSLLVPRPRLGSVARTEPHLLTCLLHLSSSSGIPAAAQHQSARHHERALPD